jgi:hypothetical protein
MTTITTTVRSPRRLLTALAAGLVVLLAVLYVVLDRSGAGSQLGHLLADGQHHLPAFLRYILGANHFGQ